MPADLGHACTGGLDLLLGEVEDRRGDGGGVEDAAGQRVELLEALVRVFATDQIPAGSYELKVALDEAWDTSFPGSNVPFTSAAGDTAEIAEASAAIFSALARASSKLPTI